MKRPSANAVGWIAVAALLWPVLITGVQMAAQTVAEFGDLGWVVLTGVTAFAACFFAVRRASAPSSVWLGIAIPGLIDVLGGAISVSAMAAGHADSFLGMYLATDGAGRLLSIQEQLRVLMADGVVLFAVGTIMAAVGAWMGTRPDRDNRIVATADFPSQGPRRY